MRKLREEEEREGEETENQLNGHVPMDPASLSSSAGAKHFKNRVLPFQPLPQIAVSLFLIFF